MRWLKRLLAPSRPEVMTLRNRELALRFAVQLPLHVRGLTRDEAAAPCGCGGSRDEVLITTGGPAGDPALWREHPLALDAFRCRKCGEVSAPRILEPAEATELLKVALEHAKAGRDDDAEFALRRVCNSWPGFAPARHNLGVLYLRRADAEELDQDRQLVRARRLDIAESHLRDALRGKGMPLYVIAGELVNVLLRREAAGAALAVLDEVAARDEVTDDDRTALGGLREYVRERGDLSRRGVDAISPHVHLDDRKPPPFDARARRAVELGVELLARHRRVNPNDWRSAWFTGKAYQTLGDAAGAARAFAEAYAEQPQNPSVGREYCLALLRVDRVDVALPVAEATCAVAPADAGLVANLALVQLLAADPERAAATVARALEMAPDDRITRALAAAIDAVRTGRRAQPRSLEELERGPM